MIRTVLSRAAVIFLLVSAPATARPALYAQTAGQATPAQAAAFVGDWTLALVGDMGPANFDLTIKLDQNKVAGQISGAEQPAVAISNITMAEKTMVLSYNLDYQGMAIDTVLSLTPGADGKVSARMEFASGAYVVTGAATKKEKAK